MSQTLAVMQLLQTRGLGPKTLGRLLDAVAQEQSSVEELVQLNASELVSRYGLKPDVANGIAAETESVQAVVEALEARNIRLLVKHHGAYPSRLVEVLGASAPPVLFAAGNLSLLKRDAVCFCGSRKSSATGLTVTRNLASDLARRGLNVVSGYAVGVDFTAHAAALEAGGVTTMVLAEGILHFRPKQGIANVLTEENTLILSEFQPEARWSAHFAMQRNRTICALSKAVVLIEAGMDGGTFNAGETAQALDLPLFALAYDDFPPSAAGNRHFLERGAVELRPVSTGQVDDRAVVDAIQAPVVAIKGNGMLFPDFEPSRSPRKAERDVS